MKQKQYVYDAICLRVVDGDTYDMYIDLGFDISVKHRVRLNGVDVYEKTLRDNQTDHEKMLGIKATQFCESKLLNKKVTIETHYDKGKYGRYLADVYVDGFLLADLLREKGYVKND